MRPDGCEAELLRRLAAMPFLDRLEMAAVSGRSRGAVYEAVERMERDGLVASIPHAAPLIPPTRRYCLTVAGLHRLARDEGTTVDELLLRCLVSEQGRRVLMERLDSLAVVYRLASAVSNAAYPIRFRWYRAMPMDAAITLPDGRTVAVVRQGLTADRTAFAKRLWRLREIFRPSAVLMLMSDEIRLRHARRIAAGSQSLTFLALEREAVTAGANAPIWRTPSGSAFLDLRTALAHTRPRGAWPAEKPPERASLPEKLSFDDTEENPPGWALPAILKETDKRALDLLSDWPWITPSTPRRAAGREAVEALGGAAVALGYGLGRRSPSPRRPPPGSLRPGAGVAGPPRPLLGGRREEAVERRAHRPTSPARLAERLREEKRAASQEHRAHRLGPLVRGGHGETGPLALQAGRTARPAWKSVAPLPPSG